MCGLRPAGKNIKNQTGTVEDTYLQFLFDIAQLFGRQFVVEDGDSDLVFRDIFLNLTQFARSDKRDGMRHIQPLSELFDRFDTRRFSQKRQLLQIFLYLSFVLFGRNQTYEYGSFRAFRCYYKLFQCF